MKQLTFRLLGFVLTVAMLLSLVACGSTDNDPVEEAPSLIENNDPLTELSLPVGIKNIILIIGDGMGPEQLRAGQLIENKTYGFTNWQSTTSNTNSIKADGSENLTDSAASATAIPELFIEVSGFIIMPRILPRLTSEIRA